MAKKVTIADIAKELKLTTATVSRALADKDDIGEKTKKLVHAMAKRLDYHPNKIASSLRSGFTQVIGILVPNAANNFFGAVINGIASIARENGYDVLIYQSDESPELEKRDWKHSYRPVLMAYLFLSQKTQLIISILPMLKKWTYPSFFSTGGMMTLAYHRYW